MTARAAAPIREADIQRAVLQMWRSLGRTDTLIAAIPNARAHGQPGLTKGLPDLLVIGGSVGIGLIELKTKSGRLKPEQQAIADLCEKHMLHHKVAYGLDPALRILRDWQILRAFSGVSL